MVRTLIAISAFFLTIPAFCQTNEKEAALGRALAAEVERNAVVLTDPVTNGYVARLARSLALRAGLTEPLTIRVLESGNARAVLHPGGHLFLTTGVLASVESEAELAAVLVHELGHAAEIRERLSQPPGSPVVPTAWLSGGDSCLRWAQIPTMPLGWLPRARLIEMRADLRALEMLMTAGYDPHALPEFFTRFVSATPNLAEALPASYLETLRSQAEGSMLSQDPIVTTDEFVDVRNRIVPVKRPKRVPSLRAAR